MRPTYLREITEDEKNGLYGMMDRDAEEAGYRAEIVLLRSEGYTVPEIRRMTNHHDNNIRKWIHRFNEHGTEGIRSRRNDHPPVKITDESEQQIVRIASTNPRELGLKFSTWSLRVLAGYLMERKIVSSISHAEVRNVLLKHGIEWRHSKTVLSRSRDPQYDLKKGA